MSLATDDRTSEVPFQPALAAMVRSARARLEEKHGALPAGITRHLLETLAWLWGPTLFLEFSVRRAMRVPTVLIATMAGSSKIMDDFLETVPALAAEYPVLARLGGIAAENWVQSCDELLTRCSGDFEQIAQTFGAAGALTEVRAGLSDPHDGGRTVCVLGFENGRRVVYKPRAMQLERAWIDLLAWCETRGLSLPLFRPRILDCGDYGWMELVDARSLDAPAQAARFYRRAGMLLCLAYVLEANDCHFENVIAHGEHPVLVDLETLLHARSEDLFEPHPDGATAAANSALWNSVIRTRFLPRWDFIGGQAIDVGGIGAVEVQVEQVRKPYWSGLGTDATALEWRPVAVAASGPRLGSEVLRAEEFGADLMAGFREMHRLLSASPPLLDGMRGARARCLIRATRVYWGLLDEAVRTPALLRDEAAFAAHLARLEQAVVPLPALHPYRRVVEMEQAALQSLDIPRFSVPVDGTSLHDARTALPDVYAMPATSRVRGCLEHLDADDCARQENIIRASLMARAATDPTRDNFGSRLITEFVADRSGSGTGSGADTGSDVDEWDGERALVLAQRIADDLAASAVRGGDGGATWIGVRFFAAEGRYQLQPVDVDLYDGGAGIGLFLAALAAVSGVERYRDLAVAAFRPLQAAQPATLGACGGSGGCMYALAHAARLLEAPQLLDEARRFARSIPRFEDDSTFDVFGGAAGGLLGFLAMGDVAGARRCADHLLVHQTAEGAWPGGHARALTGFAHGTSGIACALLRLHAILQAEEFLEAAQKAFAYEDATFSPERGGWPDFRFDPPIYPAHWCHGAPGIGLARLEAAMLRRLEGFDSGLDATMLRRLEGGLDAALLATRRHGAGGVDHLCCGRMGRAMFLFETGLARGDEALMQEARAWAAEMMARDSLSLFLGAPEIAANVGLFQGSSGIGYALLRMSRPDLVPSLLRFA